MKLERHYEATPENMVAIQYKRDMGMKADTLDVVAGMTQEFVASVKMDGELNACFYKSGKAVFANNGKRTRTKCPPSDEVELRLPKMGIQSAVFMGELYAIGEDGGRIPFGEVQHIIQKPTEAEELQMRFAVFDVIEINGKPVQDKYWKRVTLVTQLFKDGTYVHPVIAARIDAGLVKDMWQKEVLDKQMEGLVIRTKHKIVKVKVTTTQDVIVVGVIEGKGANKKKMGALVVAYYDGSNLRIAGKVGTGFNVQERDSWYQYFQTRGRGKMLIRGDIVGMVPPEKIILVASDAINISDRPVLHWDGTKYSQEAFEAPVGVGSKPRFKGMTAFKNLEKAYLGQIPDWEGDEEYALSNPPVLIDYSDIALPNPVSPRRNNPAYAGPPPLYIGPGDPIYGAFADTVLGAAVIEGWKLGAASEAFTIHRRQEVPVITEGNPGPLANVLSCPIDNGRLVYYGRGNSATQRGVMVYKCAICQRAYRKRPRRSPEQTHRRETHT